MVLLHDIGIFLDPEVRAWARFLIQEAHRAGTSLSDDLLIALEAELTEPLPFETETSTVLIDSLRVLYREVVEGGKAAHLRLDRQNFAGRFTLWHDVGTAAPSGESVAPGLGDPAPGPGDLGLFPMYPSIEGAAQRIRRDIKPVLDEAESVFLQERLRGFIAALDRIEAEATARPVASRRELDFIKRAVAVVELFLSSRTQREVLEYVPNVMEEALLAREQATGKSREELEDVLREIQRLTAETKVVRRLRELVAEAYLRARATLAEGHPREGTERARPADEAAFLDVGEGSPATQRNVMAEELRGRTKAPTLGELATLAWLELLDNNPLEAVEVISEFGVSPALAGAALLMASWRVRLADREPFFSQVVVPGIRRSILMDQEPVPTVATPPDGARLLADAFPAVLADAIVRNTPLFLELGAGRRPLGLEYAHERPAVRVLALEPNARPIDWAGMALDRPPPNFHLIAARAEELAPFAAMKPFAHGAVMVAPPEGALMAMLLSALLAVKPGGEIVVFQRPEETLPVEFLAAMGLRVRLFRIDPEGKFSDLPPSEHLEAGKPIRMARITVKGLGPAASPTDGGTRRFTGVVDAGGTAGASSEASGPTASMASGGLAIFETETAPVEGTEAVAGDGSMIIQAAARFVAR